MGGNTSVAGAGAAYWAPGSRGLGAPLEKARRYLGRGVSNNIAEYSGLLECMKRAARKGDEEVVFEVDSMLLARQIGHEWACRSPTLLPYTRTAWRWGRCWRPLAFRGPSGISIESTTRRRTHCRTKRSTYRNSGGPRRDGERRGDRTRTKEQRRHAFNFTALVGAISFLPYLC